MKRIALVLALLAFAAVPAHAVPNITVTACDTVSTSPLTVRTTFTVDIPASGPWCDFYLYADPLTATQLLDCGGAPAGFACEFYSIGYPHPTVVFSQQGRCFHSGDHFEGFQIIADRAAPCVIIKFYGPLLLQGSYHVNGTEGVDGLDGSYVIRGCLAKDAPTPASATSWGQLKSLYR